MIARLLIRLIALYKRFVSPALPSSCRFHPTCSAYAAEALRRHGLVRGLILTGGRLLRCHPYCAGGEDPVPEQSEKFLLSYGEWKER